MAIGQKIKMYYDPRGNVIRTVNPDNSEQWVIHGKPATLSSVAMKNNWSFKNYAPTPWESYTYDANDLAALTNGTSYGHDFTPKNTTTDAFGRTVKTTDHETTSDAQDVVMKYEYDIRGNLLRVTDALNRIAFEYIYDLRSQPKKEGEEEKKLPPIHTWHIDSGNKQSLFDATGKAIELSDAKGAQTLSSYDTINRPNNIWARDKSAEIITLRQYLIYGDSAGLINPENNNYLGKLYRHYDEAGLQQVNNYDFKGNVTEKTRKVISDTELLSVFGGATVDCYRVDWTGLNTAILDSAEHKTNSAYDALNRIAELIYPEDVEAKRKVLLPVYNNAGALERVELLDDIGSTSIPYVNHIAYNAKGQRLLAAYGNGVMTRYAYDRKTFRLRRLRSETYTQNNFEFTSGGSIKQDTVYSYDLAGNIITTNEATTSCGVAGSNSLTRNFVYDSLYRLLSATGRENAPTITPFWDDSYRSSDESITTAYTQNYAYDKMGNILSLQHIGTNNFTRNFNYSSNHNKLESIDIGATNYAFTYDANGNQLAETTSRKFEWDYADRMRSFYVEASGSITQYTQYLYDASGNRVKKLTRTQSGDYDSVTYIDGILEYKTDGHDEQNTLHIMDDKSRIASVRIGDNFGDTTPAIKYNLEDHLGSSLVQLEANGALVNKEEYYPFGETSFGSYAQKRYKFCGKERDNESGLYYYGARYYNAWICRFVSVDPLKDKYAQLTSYNYASNEPVAELDVDGMQNPSQVESAGSSSNSGSSEKMNQITYNVCGEDGCPIEVKVNLVSKKPQGEVKDEKKSNISNQKKDEKSTQVAKANKKNPLYQFHWSKETESTISVVSTTTYSVNVTDSGQLVDSPNKIPNQRSVDSNKATDNVPTSSSSSETNASSALDIDKAVRKLDDNALSASAGKCAKYVRIALNAGGLATPNNPVSAKDYKGYLTNMGFQIVTPTDYEPQKGDIVVMQSFTGKKDHPHGHIQMYNGSIWVSDFKQSGFWPGGDYRDNKPSYTIFRKQN